MEPVLLRPEEAAKALGLGRSMIYRLLASQALTSVSIGRSRRIPRAALEDFVRRLVEDQSAQGQP